MQKDETSTCVSITASTRLKSHHAGSSHVDPVVYGVRNVRVHRTIQNVAKPTEWQGVHDRLWLHCYTGQKESVILMQPFGTNKNGTVAATRSALELHHVTNPNGTAQNMRSTSRILVSQQSQYISMAHYNEESN